ncbi:putative lipoprotein [Hyphomonas polymorpha PS728]|uniref:Putative lipoprotein n=1 Tax=Hyphomonas polymorpha PS728 TaxID=1280954 RepID=A0A062VLL8_9PROT|nr:hypothetical protein [Hyphomonas polymorpha]KCZ99045.1 putative lipoprotein [Hyphomonas polymorpha PS728]
MVQAVGRTLTFSACAFLVLAGCAQAEDKPSIAEFIFEQLGPQSCELMPAEMTGLRLREITAANPDAPVARGQFSRGLEGEFFGGSVFGADPEGGLNAGVQGAIVAAPEDDVSYLCLVAVALGNGVADGSEVPIVPEADMDAAADGSFIAAYQIWDRDEAGSPRRLAISTASSGSARLVLNEAGRLSGSIDVELANPSGGPEGWTATLTIPAAENIISPVLRFSRVGAEEGSE